MLVKGFNHLTIRVSDLAASLEFYIGVLGMTVRHRGRTDAYLEWGTAWICLIEQQDYTEQTERQLGVDHIAFYIEEQEFMNAVHVLQENEVCIVRGPVQRGQGWSINFLDPDGTQLELHTSTLEERMKVWK